MDIKKFNPVLDAQFALVDFKACAMHALGSGEDENCRYDSITGRPVNTAQFAFRTFLDMYVSHWLDVEEYAPWQILIAHEGGHVYRTGISPDYKANRKPKEGEAPKKGPEMAEEYEKLERYLKPFLAFIGCTQAQVAGVEGDDLVTYLHQGLSPNYLCAVYTVDADMLRLVDKNTTVWLKLKVALNSYDSFSDCESDLPKNMHDYLRGLCDAEENFYDDVKDDIFRFLTLFKSIVGDSSDGYNGVKGLGPAKWFEIIKQYGIDGLEELEEIVANRRWTDLQDCADADPTDKIMNKLFELRNQWRQSWTLAELHPELCWKPTKTKLTKINWYKRVPDEAKVKAILSTCQCEDFYEEYLEELMPQKWVVDADNYDGEEVADFAELCKETFAVGWDYETWSPDIPDDKINVVGSRPTGVSFCLGKNFQYAFYIPVDHKDSANLPSSIIGEFISAIPEDTATVAHNLQFETIVTAQNYDMIIEGGYDTAIMSSYVDENEEAGLKKCTKRELNYDQETFDEVLHKAGKNVMVQAATEETEAIYEWVPAKDMREVTAAQVESYGIDDSLVTCHLFVLYWLRMQLENSWEFYAEHEPYFTKRTSLSQIKGCNVDTQKCEELTEYSHKTIKENKERLREILSEHCTTAPNKEAVAQFMAADIEYLKAKTRESLSQLELDKLVKKADSGAVHLEKIMELDDEAGVILDTLRENVGPKAEKLDAFTKSRVVESLIKLEVFKERNRALAGSVYVPYKCNIIAPQVAPTVKNLSAVCEALKLPIMESVAISRLSEWEQEVCNIDFEEDTDDTDKLDDKQRKFVELLREAKRFFKPADRETSEAFQRFNVFCCEVLGKKAKEEWTGTELSTGSPIQMQHLLYCMLGLPVRLRSKVQKGSGRDALGFEGSRGTDALVVDTALAEDIDGNPELAWKGEALECVKRIKDNETQLSLYLNAYPKLVNPETGRLHPNIKSCGTVTRRPTGGKPNILQVSKHKNEGTMRSVYLPIEDDHIIIAIDFAGQELRILASVTRDLNLLSAYLGEKLAKQYLASFGEGVPWNITTNDIYGLEDVKDLHSNTASGIVQIFGLDADGKLIAGGTPAVKSGAMDYVDFIKALNDDEHKFHSLTNKIRKKPAKTSNFLMAYGGSAQALSQKLIIKEAQGQSIVDAMMKLYPNIEKEQANTLKFAKQHGYAETAYGNRRHATSDIFSSQAGLVNRQGRQLFNSRIQGTAAEILKVVMKDAETTEGGAIWDRLNAVMMAPVYDEIVASVPVKHAWQYVKEMTPIMNLLPPNQAVPMMADISLGPDWQKQKELGSFPTQEEVETAAQEAFEKVLEARKLREVA